MSYLTNSLNVLINTTKNKKKVQSQLTIMIFYELDTFNTDRAVPYANCINRSSKISGKNYRDITD